LSGTPQGEQYDVSALATAVPHFQQVVTMAAPQVAQSAGRTSGRGAVAEREHSGLEQIAK
jgi:hypothetical protein